MSQAPKPPNPFDPFEEAQIAQMVNEGGRDTDQPADTTTLNKTVREALESLERLYNGEPAPKLVLRIDENDENHVSASWEKPPKKP